MLQAHLFHAGSTANNGACASGSGACASDMARPAHGPASDIIRPGRGPGRCSPAGRIAAQGLRMDLPSTVRARDITLAWKWRCFRSISGIGAA